VSGIISCEYFTNAGTVRENNEDSILINNLVVSSCSMKKPVKISDSGKKNFFCIADGVGGYNFGDLASKEVLISLRDTVSSQDDIQIETAVKRAKEHLDSLAKKNPNLLNFGTTLAGMYINESHITVFNCGDSRVYRLNYPFFEKVTDDHSFVETLVNEGLINEKEARVHPQKNILTSGIFGDVTSQAPVLFIRTISSRNDEMFLICSDGVWDVIDTDMLEALYKKNGVNKFADALLSTCLEKKAEDNISAIVVHVEQALGSG